MPADEHLVGHGQRQRAATAALAGHEGHHRYRQPGELADAFRDRDRLALLLRLDPRVRPRGVDEGDHRQPQLGGQPGQPDGLAMPARRGHPVVVRHPVGDGPPLVVTDHDHRDAVEPGESADDGRALGADAVAVQLLEVVERVPQVPRDRRPVDGPRPLHGVPRVDRRQERVVPHDRPVRPAGTGAGRPPGRRDAVRQQPDERGLQLGARPDHVDQPVLQQELGRLERRRQRLADRLLDDPPAGEAEARPRLGDDHNGPGAVEYRAGPGGVLPAESDVDASGEVPLRPIHPVAEPSP